MRFGHRGAHLNVVESAVGVALYLQMGERHVDLVTHGRLDDPGAVAVVRVVLGEVRRLDDAAVVRQTVVTVCETRSSASVQCLSVSEVLVEPGNNWHSI